MLNTYRINSTRKMRMYFCQYCFSGIAGLLLLSAMTQAATYYVSEQGSDSNPGTQSSPWASVNYASSQARPGDTIYVRGGTYYEEVRTYASGTASARITFKAYPGETPIIDGTAAVTGWQRCSSATDFVDHDGNPIAGRFSGNSNYQNIYKATIPASEVGYGSDIHVFENATYLMRSGLPDQLPENYIYDRIEQYKPLDPSCYGQKNYIIDTDRNEPDGYWVGATIRIYLNNNNHHVVSRTVSGWDQSEHKFTLSSALPVTLSSNGTVPDCYKLENHWGAITQQGEAYHTTHEKNGTYTLYIWPRSTADLNANIRVSKYDRGFEFINNYDDYITVDGLTFRGFSKGPNSGTHGAFGLGNVSAYAHTGIEIKNCRIINCSGTAAITLWCGTDDVFENNIIDGCRSGYGIACRGASSTNPTLRCKIKGNTISHIRSTSIKVIYSHYLEISRNKVGKSGSHGNACSLYMNNENVLFAHNITTESNSGLTLNDSKNIYIVGNALHAMADNVLAAWKGGLDKMQGEVFILNNTIQRGEDKGTGGGLGFSSANTGATFVVINNIIDGAMYSEDVLNVTRHHNLYTDYSWKQSYKYNWTLATGEFYNDDYTAVFKDPANYNYTIALGSPADNQGTDISAYLPTDKFPDYDFSVDLYGTSRGTPSLGACEGGSSGGSDPIEIEPPVAHAGSDQTIAYTDRSSIRLDGSQSTGYGLLTYTWTLDGTPVALGVSPVISFENKAAGTYTVTLTVRDGQTPAAESSDSVIITIEDELPSGSEKSTLRDGLVGYWQFTEGAGSDTADNSDYTNHASLSDLTMWSASGCMNFQSTNTYLACKADASLNLTGSLTISAWINPKSYGGSSYGRILDKGDGPDGRGFSLMLNGHNRDFGYMTYNGAYVSSNDGIIDLNTWTHICVVYDQASQMVRFFVNGRDAGSSSYAHVPADNAADALYIGLRGYDQSRHFDGQMDDVALYNRALSASEVQQLYSKDTSDEDMTALWRLDDLSGSLAQDACENQYTATLLGDPEWGLAWKDGQEECLYFSGQSQALEINGSTLSAQAGTVTLTAAPFSTSGVRFLFGHINNTTDKNLIWLYTVSGKLALGLGNNATLSTDIETLAVGTLYHIALSWDGTRYWVYINGRLSDTGAYAGLTEIAATADVANMGTAFHRTYAMGFDGCIDDVHTYSRALSADEIAALANRQEIKQNKKMEFYIAGEDIYGNPYSYTAQNLPAGAAFDANAQKFTWRPWYNQSGKHQILFVSEDGTDRQILTVSTREVVPSDWYRNFLSQNGKL